jgi:iron(III) transport system substrate-binding protein
MKKQLDRVKRLPTVNLVLLFLLLSVAPAVVYSETAEQVLTRISALSASERKAVLEAGAKDEGQLDFYTSISSGDHPKIMAVFKNRYPFLETSTYRSTPARLFTRLDTEAKAGRFAVDVLGTSPVQIWLVKEKKLSIPYRSPEVTAFPEKSYDPEGFWASYDVTPLILAYNSTLVKPEEVPTTNQELLDPRWKGRMSLGTDEYEWFAVMLESMGKDKGLAFMQSLAKQDLKLPGSSSRLRVQLMMAGEGSMAIAARARRVVEFKEMGAPVDLRILEPYPALPGVLTLMRHAPHPHAAILFFDWLLSAEGQTAMSQAPRIALRKGVKHIPRHEQLFAKEFFFVSPSFLAPNLNETIELYNKTFEIHGSQ